MVFARQDHTWRAVEADYRRQVDEAAFEYTLAVPERRIRHVLVLAAEGVDVELPLIDGDRAALIEGGFSESSIGVRSEPRCSAVPFLLALPTVAAFVRG